MMRAHLWDLVTAVVMAVVLAVTVTVGGVLTIVAGISAALFALSLRTLGAAVLTSMQPQTRHEKRVVQRIHQDIRHRMAQLQVQQASDSHAGGGA